MSAFDEVVSYLVGELDKAAAEADAAPRPDISRLTACERERLELLEARNPLLPDDQWPLRSMTDADLDEAAVLFGKVWGSTSIADPDDPMEARIPHGSTS